MKWEVWRLLTHGELPSVDPVRSDARRRLKVFCSSSPWARAAPLQRPIQNMSSPELYLFFIRMMYMINVALFAEVSCQSLALHLFFFFYAALGEESLDFGKRMAEKIRKTAPH